MLAAAQRGGLCGVADRTRKLSFRLGQAGGRVTRTLEGARHVRIGPTSRPGPRRDSQFPAGHTLAPGRPQRPAPETQRLPTPDR